MGAEKLNEQALGFHRSSDIDGATQDAERVIDAPQIEKRPRKMIVGINEIRLQRDGPLLMRRAEVEAPKRDKCGAEMIVAFRHPVVRSLAVMLVALSLFLHHYSVKLFCAMKYLRAGLPLVDELFAFRPDF